MEDECEVESTDSQYVWGLESWLKRCSLTQYQYIFENKSYSDLFKLSADYLIDNNVPASRACEIIRCLRRLRQKELDIIHAFKEIEEKDDIINGIRRLASLIPTTKEPFIEELSSLFTDVVELAYEKVDMIESDIETSNSLFQIYVMCWKAENNPTFKEDDKNRLRVIIDCIRSPGVEDEPTLPVVIPVSRLTNGYTLFCKMLNIVANVFFVVYVLSYIFNTCNVFIYGSKE